MKVVVYPADRHGCGHHRLIWPAEALKRAGHDVTVVSPSERHLTLLLDNARDNVVRVETPPGVDVVVLQRVTHRYLAQSVGVMRSQGIAVVVDVDDDLSSIHPSNPAWRDLHPKREKYVAGTELHMHSWHYLGDACRDATLVTATTPALMRRYAAHGRGRELPNYLADHYYRVKHTDSDLIGWPAALHSHPDDPAAVGNAISRLVVDGHTFQVTTTGSDVANAFGITDPTLIEQLEQPIDLMEWPAKISDIGVGIAPLADTRFNQAKSWLKPLELAAVGVPWVASPRAEYARLHKLGCGLLADKPKMWYRLLKDLATSSARRGELSEAGRAVAQQLRIRDHAWRWWEAWSDALTIQRGSESASADVPFWSANADVSVS